MGKLWSFVPSIKIIYRNNKSRETIQLRMRINSSKLKFFLLLKSQRKKITFGKSVRVQKRMQNTLKLSYTYYSGKLIKFSELIQFELFAFKSFTSRLMKVQKYVWTFMKACWPILCQTGQTFSLPNQISILPLT